MIKSLLIPRGLFFGLITACRATPEGLYHQKVTTPDVGVVVTTGNLKGTIVMQPAKVGSGYE